jgi:type VI secretion system protein VasD
MKRNGHRFFKHLFFLFFFIFYANIFLTGCASTKNLDDAGGVAKIKIVASDSINPSPSNNPSPVVLKIFQLKDDQLFTQSDFFALYLHPKKTLGEDYVNEREITVVPGESKDIQLPLHSNARYITVLAAYQNIDQAKWYDSRKINTSWGSMSVEIALDHDDITLR